ncbi:PhoPQ-activated pathogenicity-like protein PqaA type [bacterium]|nr:PhoPQ-activated pathogenicity-like protein PqaA type [bacterium]
MRRFLKILVLLFLLSLVTSSVSYSQPLIDYVNKVDNFYKWEVLSEEARDGITLYEVELTSQEWRNIIWTHRLIIGIPKLPISTKVGILFITGSWRGEHSEEVLYVEELSKRLGCISAVLFDIPNQPLFGGLYEDALIAYTLTKFAETQEEDWPLLLPMTKGAIKAMDAIEEIVQERANINLEGFVVTGASKRGWTTWLTAVCDDRVKGIAPMVYDNLNIKAQFEHQKELWGDYSPKLSDYTLLGLDKLADTFIGDTILSIIDPFSYRERIKVPKLIINGSNDPYWAIDAINLYLEELPGEKYILYVPNSGHNLEDRERVIKDISAFYLYIAGKIPFPKINWNIEEDESSIRLTLNSDINPTKVGIWYADSRDKNFVYSIWSYIEAQRLSNGYFIGIDRPKEKSIAIFGEFYYNINGLELYLCTPAILR